MQIKPDWLIGLKPVIKIILDTGKEAKFVGGCVRDSIINETSNDLDIATDASPNMILKIFTDAGIKAIPTGLKHGTVTILWNRQPIEITTLRKDIECNGRHAKIELTKSWKEDAKRRDFTFNALYLDTEGNVYDYFSGIEDLKEKRLRFVGNTRKRIEEDYLRILRAFRFHARLCTQKLDKEILYECKRAKDKIDLISGERIKSEIKKLLSYKNAFLELREMRECGILKKICGFDAVDFLSLDFIKSKNLEAISKDPFLKLAFLIRKNHSLKKEDAIDWINKRWKLSREEFRNLKILSIYKSSQKPKKDLFEFGKNNARLMSDLLYLEDKICKDELLNYKKSLDLLSVPEFPVRGQDIKNLGYQGKKIGVILANLQYRWASSDYKLEKKDLLIQLGSAKSKSQS